MSEQKIETKAATEAVKTANNSETPTVELSAKKGKKKSFWLFQPLLLVTVVVPTVCSIMYFGVIASDQFTSQSSFVVRSAKNQSAATGLGAILQGAGFSRAQDDTYTVREYLHSRSALSVLNKTLPVRKFYETQGDIFSRFNGFGWESEEEAFYQYYTDKVNVNFDSVSGVSSLAVTSFDSKHSHQINQALLKQGEELINQLNERARQDTLRYAEEAVQIAEERVKEAADSLTAFRIQHGVFDLKAQSEVQISLVSKLQDELILIQTQLDQVRAVTPENPQIAGLKAREHSLRKEIALQMKAIAGGDAGSLSTQAADYQRIILENQLAEQQLTAAITSLENAKADANRRQLYLEVIEQPSQPDMPYRPKRLYNIMATLIIGLMIYGIASLLIASVREHKN